MDKSRYSRQLILDEIGESGQKKLQSSIIAVIGCGGLGATAAAYLAGAGVGQLVLVDGDNLAKSNLHRQVMYMDSNTGNKALLLKDRLHALNPDIQVTSHPYHISKNNITHILAGTDLVLECTDRWNIKLLVSDYGHLHQLPVVYGAVFKYEGYVSFFMNDTSDSMHLRDIFPADNPHIPSCAEVGVLNTAVGIISILQANEALKYILGTGDLLTGKLLLYDALQGRQHIIRLRKSPGLQIRDIWEKSAYQDMECQVPELSYSEVKDLRKYNMVSILEEKEHQNIDPDTIHLPLSEFDEGKIPEFHHSINIFYCMVGKRSASLVTRLMDKYPMTRCYSLRGGLKALRDNNIT